MTNSSVRPFRTMVIVRPGEGGVADVAASCATEFRARGIVVTELVGDDGGSPALHGIRAVWAHRKQIREADVVHVELGLTAVSAFWVAIFVCLMRSDITTVVHDGPDLVKSPGSGIIRTSPGLRDSIAHRILAPMLDRPLRAVLRRRTRIWLTLSERARNELEVAGLYPVAVIPHGADPPISTLPPSHCTTVVFAGFIAPSKGIDVLLDAWDSMGADKGLDLQIVGDHRRQYEEYVTGLRRRTDASPLPITWISQTSEAEFQSVIAQAAIVVLPYVKSNPASGIAVRAAVEGRAIVATTVPAFADMLENEVTALLVRPGDPEALGNAILALTVDSDLRDMLGRTAASWASVNCTWKAHADALTVAYGFPVT